MASLPKIEFLEIYIGNYFILEKLRMYLPKIRLVSRNKITKDNDICGIINIRHLSLIQMQHNLSFRTTLAGKCFGIALRIGLYHVVISQESLTNPFFVLVLIMGSSSKLKDVTTRHVPQ